MPKMTTKTAREAHALDDRLNSDQGLLSRSCSQGSDYSATIPEEPFPASPQRPYALKVQKRQTLEYYQFAREDTMNALVTGAVQNASINVMEHSEASQSHEETGPQSEVDEAQPAHVESTVPAALVSEIGQADSKIGADNKHVAKDGKPDATDSGNQRADSKDTLRLETRSTSKLSSRMEKPDTRLDDIDCWSDGDGDEDLVARAIPAWVGLRTEATEPLDDRWAVSARAAVVSDDPKTPAFIAGPEKVEPEWDVQRHEDGNEESDEEGQRAENNAVADDNGGVDDDASEPWEDSETGVEEKENDDPIDDVVEKDEVETAVGWYTGQWRGEKFHGEGFLKRHDGSEYEGSFGDGRAHGYGKIQLKNGHTYEGEWICDLASGYGVYETGEGECYKGEWHNNLKYGKGLQTWGDGTSYEGQFKDDSKHGAGVFCHKDGDVRYRGQFNKNRMHGVGTYVFDNGRTYEGDWISGHMQGKGVMLWPDGSRYEGEFGKGLRHGDGAFDSANGMRYAGQWQAGKQHGLGATITGDGRKMKGRWANGTVVERHKS